jgi:4-deoxy-L-threo-5-hexosulose-uronate ketol-isomerase
MAEMEERFQNHPAEVSRMNTEELRHTFSITSLMQPGKIRLVYSHFDRMVIGGVIPVKEEIRLETDDHLKSDYFLERREMGIINIGNEGIVKADGIEFTVGKLDCVYLGRGTKKVSFMSKVEEEPAIFYLLSDPAHCTYENKLMRNTEAAFENVGDMKTSNRRTIYK